MIQPMTTQEFLAQLTDKLKSRSYPKYIKQKPADIAADIAKHARFVIEGEMIDEKPDAPGQSKIGGQPDLPEDFAWPCEDDDEDMPMAFLCQINLADVHEHDLEGKLPAKGMLWFFTIADGDRAYSYEIDCDTTKVHFLAEPGDLRSREIPEALAEEENAKIEEGKLVFGPSISLEEEGENGVLESKRYDGSIEEAVRKAVRSLGGRSGIVRMLGNAHFFREENQGDFDPEKEEVLAEFDGYSIAQDAFGEGGFTWTISKDKLKAGALDSAFLIFEPGT
jgi:hypothetical protein